MIHHPAKPKSMNHKQAFNKHIFPFDSHPHARQVNEGTRFISFALSVFIQKMFSEFRNNRFPTCYCQRYSPNNCYCHYYIYNPLACVSVCVCVVINVYVFVGVLFGAAQPCAQINIIAQCVCFLGLCYSPARKTGNNVLVFVNRMRKEC